MLSKSEITGKIYETDDVIYLLNPLQVYRYLKHGGELLDVDLGNDDKLLFVFNRNNTKHLYDAWCKHELD